MKATTLKGNIHVWVGTGNRIMVSHENTKELQSFQDVNRAVNGLYLSGFKDAARELHEHTKGAIS